MPAQPDVVIIAPCFNENRTVEVFLADLEKALESLAYRFRIVIIDDGSTDDTLEILKSIELKADNLELSILTLQFNSGHQGAIYQGLLYCSNLPCDKFIIMDSDGEDDPTAIKELVKINGFDIVHVIRGKRNESFSFKLAYYFYKIIFRAITGKVLNFGNYCMINKKIVLNSCHTSFIHFAAHLSKQKAKSKGIVYDRRKRLDGKSKMSFQGLVNHAFKSFIEYGEELLMVFLKLFVVIGIFMLIMVGVVLYKKFISMEAVIGWASTILSSLFNMALISLGFFILGILMLNVISRGKNIKEVIYEEIEKQPFLQDKYS
ncbi:undecaprenyl-phosphate 4-deoxy-4-formamido-L-arabinose transferase [Arcticibacter tournemirensis]|uniref:Glycosyltransferase n=1 Tax=Arcticibacter tournemirensis TaxID=699437 RepID=A0A5M9HC25_9SPHI|nr:glycosyltransferase [Arcticibacter tournemirensis]KAA8482788.1 glycosyltransferase [Arcticibacter tournemirensis]TQM51089.1 undecaprenyl-phosphate 4-deoxy-4-formamido-L-arabinose transferase [Arcticibacter tournemirensis]